MKNHQSNSIDKFHFDSNSHIIDGEAELKNLTSDDTSTISVSSKSMRIMDDSIEIEISKEESIRSLLENQLAKLMPLFIEGVHSWTSDSRFF
jgi:hypothetical protein